MLTKLSPHIRKSCQLAIFGLFCATPAAAIDILDIPQIDVIASRLDTSIAGTSTSVISAEDIARAPAQSLPDILASRAGIQLQTLYGVGAGANTAIDLRGFGAFATANTLILINGRRLNDLDLAGVDLAALPMDAIERIEIIRGNSGAVLYGDNAVGGVINIVTKSAAGTLPRLRIEGGIGSFHRYEGNLSASGGAGPFSASAFLRTLTSNGYRANNKQVEQAGVGEIRYRGETFTAFLNLSADNQSVGLPGGRSTNYYVNGLNQLALDPRGATTPFDYADKQGVNVTTGFTYQLTPDIELIVDGGLRHKAQQAGFFGDPADIFATSSYVDSVLNTWSLTPRLKISNTVFGAPSRILTGIDFYDAIYHSERSLLAGLAPIHTYDLSQQSLGAYWQQTLTLIPSTDVSFGGRIQNTWLDARDIYNPAAPTPPFSSYAQSTPLNSSETQYALHLGIDHRVNEMLTLFARAGRAFRTPNVDERLFTGPGFDFSACAPICPALPQNFRLATQTSWDIEAGARIQHGPLDAQFSVFDMYLKNEIHYDPVNMYNINLDPTRRTGAELQGKLALADNLRLSGSLAYTRAIFRSGPYASNAIPLVSRWSGSFGVSWDAWQKYLVIDALARLAGPRRFDNDQANMQPMIPGAVFVDLKLSGEIEKFFWSLALNNVFDRKTYDYGIASTTTYGLFNAYPLPGRNVVFKAGVQLN